MLTVLYVIGVARYITDFEENTCEMTYMFEYPQYVRISLKNDIEEKYPRFGLYAYGEGFLTERLRRMHFTGIPVLFVPGNAGSHEQVRSIASVSLRKSRKTFHFDFFTVSFSKDYSALYGGVLMEQTVYVSHCIKAILALYKGKMNNVILIGHSMGGIVAKGALLLAPNMNVSSASMIINLATPHTPSLVLDSIFANYYYKLEKYLYKIKDAGVKVVSIGGGPRDILVSAAQTFDRTADINVLSTSVPTVWKSTDHLSILWCKQLVFAVVRSLFDSVDHSAKPPKITSSPDLKMESLSYHFLQHTSGKKLYHYTEKVQFEVDGEWVSIPQQYVWNNKNGAKKLSTIYLAVELFHKSDFLTIDAINLQNKDWLFVCSSLKKQDQKKICEWGWNLTNSTRLIPDPLYRPRRTIDLDLREIKYPHVTHAIVRITPEDLEKHLTISFDSYFYNNRIESTRNKFLHPKYLFGFRGPNLIETMKRSVRYYITLLNIIDAVTIELKSPNCPKYHAIVELLEPNVGSTQSRIFTNTDDGPKTMKMQTLYGRSNDTASLRMTLEPECVYMINVQPGGIIDKISCRIRDRWPLLYMAIISLLLLFISIRIHYDSDTLPTIIITVILSFIFNVTYETCIALCIIGISAIGVCLSVIFLGSVAHGIAVRFIARAIAFSITWSDWLLTGLNQLPFIITVLVLSLIPTTCGALGMLISVFLYFLKLTKMYEDYLEDILLAPLQHFNWFKRLKSKKNAEENKDRSISQEIYNHLILFLLCTFAAIPAVPSVLVWAKNFSYDMRLSTEDPVLMASWTVLAVCSILGIVQISPNHKGYRSLILSNLLRFTSWVILSMTAAPHPSFYQWCMPPITAIIVMLITLNSIIPYGQSN